MNYPTTAEIKKAIRQLKDEAYEWSEQLADSLAEEYPDSDPKAVRRAGFHTRFGYDDESNTPRWGGAIHSRSELRDFVEDADVRILWITAEMYPTVTWVNPHSEDKRREEVEWRDVWDYPIDTSVVELWDSGDY